jgi:hypothetical protein
VSSRDPGTIGRPEESLSAPASACIRMSEPACILRASNAFLKPVSFNIRWLGNGCSPRCQGSLPSSRWCYREWVGTASCATRSFSGGIRLAFASRWALVPVTWSAVSITTNLFVMISLGAIIGLAGELACGRLVDTLLFEVKPTDPGIVLGSILLLRNGIRPITLHVILHIATLTTTVVLGVLTMPGLASLLISRRENKVASSYRLAS